MKNTSITKIAERLGIAPSTVSRALNDKYGVKPVTRQRVLAMAQQLGYVPNELARELVTGKTHLIGIVLPELGPEIRPPLFDLVPDVNKTLGNLEFETIIRFFNRDGYQPYDLQRFCQRRHVEGIVVLPGFGPQHPIYNEVRSGDMPCVVFAENVVGPHCSCITTDERMGMQLAVTHLVDCGHKDIAFVNGPPRVTLCQSRRKGYELAMSTANLPISREYVMDSDFTAAGGGEAALALVAKLQNLTAICFANDMMALGAMGQFQSHGIHIPDEISIVGYDNTYPVEFLNPPLTTVAHNSRMGIRCGEILYELIQGAAGNQELMEPRLVKRQSVASIGQMSR